MRFGSGPETPPPDDVARDTGDGTDRAGEPEDPDTSDPGDSAAADRAGDDTADDDATDKQQSPADVYPWEGEATRADKICLTLVILVGLYSLATLPLRPLILKWSSHVLAVFSGSNLAMIDIGAGRRLGGEPLWWLWVLLAALTSIKFDWIYWWAGRLWGHKIVRMMIGKSRFAIRAAWMAEKLAARFGAPAVFAIWFIPFMPSVIVYAFVGLARVRLWVFLLADFLGGVAYRGLIFYLGYEVGTPAKDFIKVYTRYAWYIAIALFVFVLYKSFSDARKDPRRLSADR